MPAPRPATRRLLPCGALVAVLVGWCAHDPGAAAPTPEAPAPGDAPIERFALQVATALQSGGQAVDREVISRYFAAYPLPTAQAEIERLFGTSERILRAFIVSFHDAAAERAVASGSGRILPEHARAAVAVLLPRRPTAHKTVVFFPDAPPAGRLEVETIDLQAFAHTPIPWGALIAFSQSRTSSENLLPWSDEAVPVLAQAVSDCGLLLFKLGGLAARAELARALASPHLRQAEKAVGQQDAALARAEPSSQPPAGDDFVDVAGAAGLAFRHVSSDWLSHFRRFGTFAPTFSGGGVSAGDLDGDTWPDLVVCGGEGCAAFRNRRNGTFEDVTEASRLNVPGEARMAVLADFDNDGDADVFLTYAREPNRLFANRGDGTFEDVTEASGLGAENFFSGPAVAFDFDNDALLDLYVGNFGDYLAGETPWQAVDNQNAQSNRLYRNLGRLRFEDVTDRAGVGQTGWAQAISHLDYDLDGWQDLYISNDFGRNELYRNNGDGTFSARGAATGTDDEFHGMNVAFADLNRDAYPDIFITNIWGRLIDDPMPAEHNKLLLSVPGPDGVVFREDLELIPGLTSIDTGWSWAALFFDADNDGDDDLYLVNGHSDYSTFLQYREHPTKPGEVYPINNGREPNRFFRNDGGVLRVSDEATGAEMADLNSRALALLDYDRDGDLDMAVSTFHANLRLLRNDLAPPGNRWLAVELVGDPERGSNRDAIGATLVARTEGGASIWRMVTGGEGYLGMSSLTVELGLGDAVAADLEITWPSGERQVARAVEADRIVRVRQGVAEVETVFIAGDGSMTAGAP